MDGEEGHKEPKDCSLKIAEIGCNLGLPSFTMISTKYQDILAEHLVVSARKLRLGCSWIVQHDNDSKHTSKSPDLNPIKNLN